MKLKTLLHAEEIKKKFDELDNVLNSLTNNNNYNLSIRVGPANNPHMDISKRLPNDTREALHALIIVIMEGERDILENEFENL